MDDLYNRLKTLCDKKGVSLAKMCSEAGIPKSTPTELKMGRTKTLSSSAMIKVANYFGVSVEYIAGKTDQKEKAPAAVSDEDVKVALFGGDTEVTDEMWHEVMNYAEFLKQKYGKS
ncbi:MAG: helix-turn-helix transcriptional regulator [Clostridia bacterium]|nr:helix-turn-helix transcriptional regulator [Clostridia bacterium]